MGNKIIVCGGNGAGKSTLGKSLAGALGYKFLDIEDYYFPKTNIDYIYACARTKEEVSALLLADMKKYDNLILASVKGNYGDEVISMFTCAVYINVPKNIRMERVRDRSFQRFGDRILPNGDLYEKEKQFFDMVESRSEQEAEDWLKSVHVPIIRVDGTKPIIYNTEVIIGLLKEVFMNKYKFFWDTMELCDWTYEGDDDKVLMPVIQFLSEQDDSTIFKFDDLMSELLYDLDTKKLAGQCQEVSGYMSDDLFLYSRCVALINGPDFYEQAKNGQQRDMWSMEFESLLYVPARAWALKHQSNADAYPHFAPLSFETGSNVDGWKE